MTKYIKKGDLFVRTVSADTHGFANVGLVVTDTVSGVCIQWMHFDKKRSWNVFYPFSMCIKILQQEHFVLVSSNEKDDEIQKG